MPEREKQKKRIEQSNPGLGAMLAVQLGQALEVSKVVMNDGRGAIGGLELREARLTLETGLLWWKQVQTRRLLELYLEINEASLPSGDVLKARYRVVFDWAELVADPVYLRVESYRFDGRPNSYRWMVVGPERTNMVLGTVVDKLNRD